jgi:hypothetical protein
VTSCGAWKSTARDTTSRSIVIWVSRPTRLDRAPRTSSWLAPGSVSIRADARGVASRAVAGGSGITPDDIGGKGDGVDGGGDARGGSGARGGAARGTGGMPGFVPGRVASSTCVSARSGLVPGNVPGFVPGFVPGAGVGGRGRIASRGGGGGSFGAVGDGGGGGNGGAVAARGAGRSPGAGGLVGDPLPPRAPEPSEPDCEATPDVTRAHRGVASTRRHDNRPGAGVRSVARMLGTASRLRDLPRWAPAPLAALAVVGLAGCPTVDLGETPADPGVCRPDALEFRDVIWPEYLAPADTNRSCVGMSGCHDASDGRSALRLETDVAGDPTAHDRNYAVVIRFLNCGTPDASSLLTKPLAGLDPHGGGDIFPNIDDPAVMAFEAWLQP